MHGALKGYLKDGNSDLVKVCLFAMDRIYTEAKRMEKCGMDSKKCGFVIRKTFGLPGACLIAKKMKNGRPIRLDEIHCHWKKLYFEDEHGADDVADDYSCLAEWKAIQERWKASNVSVKNDIRNQLRLIAYPQTTTVKSPLPNAKSKGAKKKKRKGVARPITSRPTTSTSRDLSRWEHIDAHVAATQGSQSVSQTKPSTSQTKPKVSKEAPSGNLARSVSHITFVDHMPSFIHPFIEDIVDVKGDGYCGYRAVCLHKNGSEDDFELLRLDMKRELSLHKEVCVKLFGGEERLEYITNALFPPPRRMRHAVAPQEKWFNFPDMGYIVATILDRVVVLLSTSERSGASKTCFPLRGIPPSNIPPSDLCSRIICIGALPEHFVLVKLKQGCPIPPTAQGWKRHCSKAAAAAWESLFLERQQKFEELLTIERGGEDMTTIGKCSKEEPITC
ncbi:hypothetical protein OROGR_025272 [Orobanche gracilis]